MNRILWVDDEIDLLQPYIIYLKEKNYEVVTASNGEDALNGLGLEAPDIVFLDENMPGMSGLEVLSSLRKAKRILPGYVDYFWDHINTDEFRSIRKKAITENDESLIRNWMDSVPSNGRFST